VRGSAAGAHTVTQTVKEFWNQRAALGETAGTQDLILKQLEHRAILAEVQRLKPKRILEVGCGRGELAREIVAACPWVEQYDACDNSEGMFLAALKEDPYSRQILKYHHCELADLPTGPYDCIITERMLINLPNAEAQNAAVLEFVSRLDSGGAYLMCEHFREGLVAINSIRYSMGLPCISAPWHNCYLNPALDGYAATTKIPFSAVYYFLSRVVNAKLAHDAGHEPDYDSPINRLALSLPPDCVDPMFAMARLWVWRKA
jgi:ubiquinone/menaquinone biosynthesis C-methylase UbiE